MEKNPSTSYEYWVENVMDERLNGLDAEEKQELYLKWKNSQK